MGKLLVPSPTIKPGDSTPDRSDDKPRDLPQVAVAVKGSAEYGAWLADLAEHQRIKTVELVDQAVVHYARHIGFDRPAPPRYPKR